MKINEIIVERLNVDLDMGEEHGELETVLAVISGYKAEGLPDVPMHKVLSDIGSELGGQVFTFQQLQKINSVSDDMKRLVSTIDTDKIKLRDVSITNDDPDAVAEKKSATVSNMAQRRASKGL
jgi:hypothetical protein